MKIELAPDLERGEHWDTLAACGELMRADPQTFDEYFYPDEFRDRAVTRMAIKICQACPVRVQCLNDALAHDDKFAVKGGTTPRERAKLLKLPINGNLS